MVGPCVEKSGENTFKPSHFHEGLGPGERKVQDLRQQRRRRRLSRASTKHTSGAEQKCTTREVIGQRKCPRQLFGRGVTEAGWQQAGRVSE